MKIDTQDRQGIFGNAEYIKATENAPSFSYTDPLPFFRKDILIDKPFEKAEISVQAPGFAKFYINGNHITEDIFISRMTEYIQSIIASTPIKHKPSKKDPCLRFFRIQRQLVDLHKQIQNFYFCWSTCFEKLFPDIGTIPSIK